LDRQGRQQDAGTPRYQVIHHFGAIILVLGNHFEGIFPDSQSGKAVYFCLGWLAD
jgi:hypothetical protein